MRRLDAQERALWQRAMQDVRRFGAAPLPRSEAAPAPAAAAPAAPRAAPRIARAAATGMDRRSANRLKRGQMPIEARLDLHGLTQQEAHRALLRFLERGCEAGWRAALIVTGKGEGVLRTGVARWLAEPALRAFVIAVADAGPRHGGEGAKYVLLRRRPFSIQGSSPAREVRG